MTRSNLLVGASALAASLVGATIPATAQGIDPYEDTVSGWQIACGPFEFPGMNQLGEGCAIERLDEASDTRLRIALRAFFDAYVPRLHLVVQGAAIGVTQPEILVTVDEETSTVGGDIYAAMGDDPFTVILVGVNERFVAGLREADSIGVTYRVAEGDTATAIIDLDGLGEAWVAATESQGWLADPEL